MRATHRGAISPINHDGSLMATLATPYVHPFGDAVVADHGQVRVVNEAPLASERMDQLVEFTAEIGDLKQAVPAFL